MMSGKKTIKTYFVLIFILTLISQVLAEPVIPELLSLDAKENTLVINVAKKYPEIKLLNDENSNKIFLELLDSKYHNNFKFDIPTKIMLLSGLNFINDVSVGIAAYGVNGEEKQKVGITLSLIEGVKYTPTIVSKKDSIITISFLPQDIPNESKSNTPSEALTALFNNAIDEHVKGNLTLAEDLYREILSSNMDFYLAEFNLAKIYLDKEMYDQAIVILNDLIQNTLNKSLNPENLNLFKNTLGKAYYLKRDFKKAEELFLSVKELNSVDYEAYFNLGLVYEKLKDVENLDKAKFNFQKTLDLKSDHTESYYHLGILNLITKDKKDAIANFKKVVELAPDTKISQLSKEELYKIDKKSFKQYK